MCLTSVGFVNKDGQWQVTLWLTFTVFQADLSQLSSTSFCTNANALCPYHNRKTTSCVSLGETRGVISTESLGEEKVCGRLLICIFQINVKSFIRNILLLLHTFIQFWKYKTKQNQNGYSISTSQETFKDGIQLDFLAAG